MSKNFLSFEQLKLLDKRIRFAEETAASKEFYSHLLTKIHRRSAARILVVGTGASYPAAIFAKYALEHIFRNALIDSQTPQTAFTLISKKYYDFVIGISYSGKTPDIKEVASVCAKIGANFVLVTGAKPNELDNFYLTNYLFKIISYYNPRDNTGKEYGMASMASTLIPCIIFDDNGERKLIHENQMALASARSWVNDLDTKKIASLIKSCPIVHVFYEHDTLVTALDIQNKFTESGIANVILHEKKNFSKRMYTTLYTQPFSLLINLTRFSIASTSDYKFYRTNYDKLLAKFLNNLHVCKPQDTYYLEFGTSVVGAAQWNIEALTKLPYLIAKIGEELGIDISQPLVPHTEEAFELYNYTGDF